jgi:hypothetical protein
VAAAEKVVKLPVDLVAEDKQFILKQELQETHLQQVPLKETQVVKVDHLVLLEKAAEAAEKAALAAKELQAQVQLILLQDQQ